MKRQNDGRQKEQEKEPQEERVLEQKKEHGKHLIVIGIFLMTAGVSGCFAAGYGASELLFQITGYPRTVWAHVIGSLFGLLIFSACAKLFQEINNKIHKGENKRHHFVHDDLLDNALVAMSQIARGNFNVFVSVNKHDPYSELADSINEMAKELNSMENLRQDFISNVSHEIQSPLTSISGFASLLKSDSLGQSQREHYIDIIETESKRLSKLSDNLLKLSSLEADAVPFSRYLFRLDKQIEHAALMLEPQWSAKQINLALALEKAELSGDEELLSQVWINLLHNAIKFTPEDGAIHITLKENTDEICCTIADTGIGIAKEEQVHVFERFYKVDKARDRSLGGNGLGLSLVKKIVELHGGKITFESELGRGTIFTVILPK